MSIATTIKTEFGQPVRLYRWECLVCDGKAGIWVRDEVAARAGMKAHRHSPRHAARVEERRPPWAPYTSARCNAGKCELCNTVGCVCACHAS